MFQEFPMSKQITAEVRDFKLLVCKPNCKLYIYYWTIFRLPKFRIIRPCLDFFYHSSFNFRHSLLIIYHSSLKMPIILHEVCLASSLNICHGWPNLNIGNIPCCSNSLIKFQEFPMWKQITAEVRDFKLLVCKPNCKLYIYIYIYITEKYLDYQSFE